ncbi:MAG: pectate lyase [Rhodocyclaceae bacterium]
MNMKYIVGAVALALASSATFAATGASCKSTGSVSVAETIKIDGGTYDGGCKTFNGTSALGDGSQGEAQKAYFRIMNGATLKNVIIGKNGADGIHSWYGGTLDNITWTDIGEDAFSVKKAGNVTLKNITGKSGEDKFIQQNAEGTITVTNCILDGAAKFYRQNGGKTFKTTINVSGCDISNLKEGVFRTDSSTSVASLKNSRIRNVPTICIGYASGKCTSSGVTTF